MLSCSNKPKIDIISDIFRILSKPTHAEHYSLFRNISQKIKFNWLEIGSIRNDHIELSLEAKFYMKMKFTTNISVDYFLRVQAAAKCRNEAYKSSVILNVSILSSFIVYANLCNLFHDTRICSEARAEREWEREKTSRN